VFTAKGSDDDVRCLIDLLITKLSESGRGVFSSYYLVGSHADGSAVAESDIDIIAIVRRADYLCASATVDTTVRRLPPSPRAGGNVPRR
jgi:hypothetical protein